MKYLVLLHAMNSFFLLACKEVLFATVLQIFVLLVFVLQRYKMVFELYGAVQNILLILLFATPWLYFSLLWLLLYLFWREYEKFYALSAGRIIGLTLLLFGLYYYFEPLIYEWMFWLDLPLAEHYIDTKLFLFLSFLHAVLLFLLIQIKQGGFKKN